MLAPINYMLENKNPLDSFFGGMKAVQGVQQDDNTLKQQELVNEKQAALQQRQAEYDAAVDQVDIGDMSAMQGLITRFPEMSKGVQDAYDKLDEKRKQATVSNLSRLSSLLKNGKSSDAITLLQQQVEGSRNAGNEQEAKEAEAMIETIRISPDAGLQTMTWGLANILPKDAAANYKDVSTAYNDKDELPSKINKNQATAFKDNVDATNTVSEGLSTAAIGGDAAGFSLKVGMMHAQGLITDDQKAYIDERLADEDPEAVEQFLDGLAGQNVEIAKLNKPEVSIVNAGGQLVAFKKNADGSIEVVGSVDKTLDPDVQYTQDSAGERVKLTTNASMYNAEQSRLLQEYKINLDDKNASKKLELAYAIEDNKKGVSKLENHGGKMYWVYPDQTAIPAKDINGKDIKPTVKTDSTVRTAIAEQQSMIDNGNELLRALRKAKVLSDQGIYFGKTAGARASIASNFKGGSEVSKRTQQYDTLITNSALQSMKSIFGGNPTEGERAILLKIQASSEYPREVREKILNEAIAAAQNRIKSNQKQIQTLSGGQAGATKTSTNYGSVIEPIKK